MAAARGLDIPHIRTVINYDVARDIDTHTHRVGRTGRAGQKGTAYTLVTAVKDIDFCAHLVRNLEGANQRVPSDVIELALKVNVYDSEDLKRVIIPHEKRTTFSQTLLSKIFNCLDDIKHTYICIGAMNEIDFHFM